MSENCFPPTLLDEKTQTPEIMAIKAIIPFMEPSVGRMAAVFVKLMELQEALQYIDGELSVRSRDMIGEKDMLSAIRPYCGERVLEAMVTMETMLEMRDMAERMNAANVRGSAGEED